MHNFTLCVNQGNSKKEIQHHKKYFEILSKLYVFTTGKRFVRVKSQVCDAFMPCDVTAYERTIRISWAWYLCWWAVILWGSVESCFQRFLCWGTRKTFFKPLLHPSHTSERLVKPKPFFFLPDVSLIKEFVPTFLNDVIHQVRLKNPFLQLSVFLKAFYLEDRKSDNLQCYRQVSTAFHFTQILSVLLGSGCAWMVLTFT